MGRIDQKTDKNISRCDLWPLPAKVRKWYTSNASYAQVLRPMKTVKQPKVAHLNPKNSIINTNNAYYHFHRDPCRIELGNGLYSDC